MCEQHKHGSVRGAPEQSGVPTRSPSTGADEEVQVLRKAGCRDPHRRQRRGENESSKGSRMCSQGSRNTKAVRGDERRGQRAADRDLRQPRSLGVDRTASGEHQRSYLGRSCLGPERVTRVSAEQEVSSGHSRYVRRWVLRVERARANDGQRRATPAQDTRRAEGPNE